MDNQLNGRRLVDELRDPGKKKRRTSPSAISSHATKAPRQSRTQSKTIYRAPALDKGLNILELLADKQTPMSMPEIAQSLGRAKTEIYRMLVVLEEHGYIERGEYDDRYAITSRLFELGMRHPPTRNLHDAALPIMHKLAEQTQQSCHIGVIAGDNVVIIARVESPSALGFAVRVGHRVPLLDSASARVMFGALSQARQAQMLEHLRQAAPSKKALDQFLAEARAGAKRGYVLEPSRLCEGIRDVGAPISDGESLGGVASLIVPFVTYRRATTSLEFVIERTLAAAAEISNRLRHG